MAGQNLYLSYKNDTSRLLYWVINTSNGIVTNIKNHDPHVKFNTTGQSTVSEIVEMSKTHREAPTTYSLRYLRAIPGRYQSSHYHTRRLPADSQ